VADLIHVEAAAVRAAWREFHHPTDVADRDAKAGGKFLEWAVVEGGGVLPDHGCRLGGKQASGAFPGAIAGGGSTSSRGRARR